ncbi:hypothetical protein MBLNU13_g06734t1 [Cladosporium sp. NU13]
MVVAPQATPTAIEQKAEKSETAIRHSDCPPLGPISMPSQEHGVLYQYEAWPTPTAEFSEPGSTRLTQLVADQSRHLVDVSNEVRIVNPDDRIGCNEGNFYKVVDVAADKFNTHIALKTVPQVAARLDPSIVVDTGSGARSSTSVEDEHDAKSQAAESSAALSSMSSIYGSKSLYQRTKLGSSEGAESSLPALQAFDTTIDATLYEAARKSHQHLHEAPQFSGPPHIYSSALQTELAQVGRFNLHAATLCEPA